jgi:pilus assembly protein CpaE
VSNIDVAPETGAKSLLRGIGDVAVVASTPDFEMRVRRALSSGRGPRMLRWQADAQRPDDQTVAVVLIGPELPPDLMVATAQEIDRENPGAYVALVAEPLPGLLEKALRAGVRDVISPTAEIPQIYDLLARGLESAQSRKPVPSLAPVQPVHAGPTPDESGNRIIVVVSPKGGVGKTLVAVNLGCALGAVHRNEVCLVDLDLQFGDVAASMHIAPEHSTVDAARGVGRGESSLIKVFLHNHESGVFVLCAPDDPASADDIPYDASVAITRQLSSAFPYVIVDTPAGLDPHTLSVAEVATDLLFVCSVDVASVRSLRKTLDAFDKLGMRTQRRHLVVNRADTPGGARVEDVETALGMTAITSIPGVQNVLATVNQGSPISYSDPKSPLARKFQQIAETFSESVVAAPAQKSSGLPWKRSK